MTTTLDPDVNGGVGCGVMRCAASLPDDECGIAGLGSVGLGSVGLGSVGLGSVGLGWLSSRLRAFAVARGGICVALALIPSGCGNKLDDLFCDPHCPSEDAGGQSAGGGASDAGDSPAAIGADAMPAKPPLPPPPILPRLPDDTVVEACEHCTAEACEAERAACLQDDVCTAQLRCYGECSDPGCAEQCRASVALDGVSPFYMDLALCSGDTCATTCRTGANWQCADEFIWPGLVGDTFLDAYVRFGTGQQVRAPKLALAGASVRACCPTSSLDAVLLDAANGAELQLPTGASGFSGHFELEGEHVRGGLRHLIQIPPLIEGGTVDVFLYEQYALMDTLDWIPSENTAALLAVSNDCAGVPASRVSLRIVEQPDARVAHQATEELSYDAEISTIAIAFFPELNVPESGVVTLQVVLPESENQVVTERQIPVREGWLSQATLAPRSLRGF